MPATFQLEHGAATVLTWEEMAPPVSKVRRLSQRELESYCESTRKARAKVLEAFERIAAGRRPARTAPPRFARGVTLPGATRGVPVDYRDLQAAPRRAGAEAEIVAYVQATGRRPRSIVQALEALGVTDAGRLETAAAQWDGTYQLETTGEGC